MKETIHKLKNSHMLPRVIFGGMLALYFLLILIPLYNVYVRELSTNNYLSWPVSEWMINYEGGFVRRGLCGQLLYWLYQWHPYPIREAIVLISLAGFILFMSLVIRIFLREGWSFFLLITPFLIFFPLYGGGELFNLRRDHWLLLFAYAIFYLYSNYAAAKNFRSLGCLWGLSILVLLSHEASFFFIFPILILHHFAACRNQGCTLWQILKSSLTLFTPAVCTMLLVCIFKGDQQIVDVIWQSWYPCMEKYPLPGDYMNNVGAGVKALTWETWWAVKFHIERNFCGWYLWPIPKLLIIVLNYTGVYYLVTRMNMVNMGWNRLLPVHHNSMSNVIIVQFLCMLPLLTVLSCDASRVMSYWVFSSLFAYHILKSNMDGVPDFLSAFSASAQSKIRKSAILMHPFTYVSVVVLLPVCLWQTSFEQHILISAPMTFISILLKLCGVL